MRAVDVGAMSNWLTWEAVRDGIELSSLQTAEVVPDTSSNSAVLSWRWDKHQFQGRSRNVALALSYALRVGIRYVFIDFVSIESHLQDDDLIKQVVAFSELYKTLPVLAAYDAIDVDVENIDRTLNRPWILHERRLYCNTIPRSS